MTNDIREIPKLRISARSISQIQELGNDAFSILRDAVSDIAIDIAQNTYPELELGNSENDDDILLDAELDAESIILSMIFTHIRREMGNI